MEDKYIYLMSLTSTELNYLVWRYLQESGFELAAFSLDKESHCLDYEADNSAVIEKIEPGCLVNLVQRGILYTVVDENTSVLDPKEADYSFVATLVKDELAKVLENDKTDDNRFKLKSEVKNSKTCDGEDENNDVEMEEEFNEEKPLENEKEVIEFSTKFLEPKIHYSESVTSSWHPIFDVFSYGKGNSTATINAITNDDIAESVTLNHPNVAGSENDINITSWAPHGTLMVTVGSNGELRAWSPDGKLKNIANTYNFDKPEGVRELESPVLITNLIWNENGQYILTISSENEVCLWDGNNLNVIHKLAFGREDEDDVTVCACWLDDSKFAISTQNYKIKIFSIVKSLYGGAYEIRPIGSLVGHENNISLLAFNNESKLLASCSDFDYSIKIWTSSSTRDPLDLNTKSTQDDIKNHKAPIIGLFWLNKINDDSILLSISMDGVLNMWNATTGESIVSTNLFYNEKNFRFEVPNTFIKHEEVLGFNASVSPDNNYLVVGDDFGRISVWDISPTGYSSKHKDFLKCLGVYNLDIKEASKSLEGKDAKIGICDLTWNSKSQKFNVSYKGADSLIFYWE